MKPFKTPLIIGAILAVVACLLFALGLNAKQVVATDVFLMIICGTLFYWKFRLAFALMGLSVLLGTKLIDIPHVIEFAGLDIILFLFGMMAIVGFLEENHFFEYLVAKVVDWVGERPYLLMTLLMILSTVFAALVDEVTSILFMMSTMFHITKRYKVNPIPFLLMIVFATNIGSSATAVGNPIGVMIALRAKLSFMVFIRWAAPISVVNLIVTIGLCFWLFRKNLQEMRDKMTGKGNEPHELRHVHFKKSGIYLSWTILILTVAS